MQENRAHIAAAPRTVVGKKIRFLRRDGWLPANVYGRGVPSQAIQLKTREVEHLLAHTPRNALLALDLDQSPLTVLVKDVARKPTTGELYHVDFYQVSMTQQLRVSVPLVLTGESPAVKLHDATLLHAVDSIEVECLPGDLPTQITVPVDTLGEIDDAIFVRDLAIPPRVTVLTPADELVVKALAPTVEEVAPEEVEAAAAPAEAEAPVAPEAGEGGEPAAS
ncbi:MAG TPA: 50S ribosomal protein L25 [Chloroflexota bacterium]|nr:50S ribosomal protein L25 [Chloroflexota bacterium]